MRVLLFWKVITLDVDNHQQIIKLCWFLIKNEELYSALLLGGVYTRNLRSVVVMNVVNQ